ncbi:Minf_1886 family protein [Gemmatimonas phototrophica]|nr:Minf_1886 family protein [Gemmatimonas phototrophica]
MAVLLEEQDSVTELAFREGIMDQIRLREQRFDERAYLFVLSALEHSQTKLTERRHITGPELAHACRDLALQRFGVMAKVVLDHWGIRSTLDIGDIVFTLVDLGLLISQPQDSRDDFYGVFDFADAFDREYPWSTTHV